MEGLIPFVIDVIRRSQERGGGGAYRGVSSDGGSSRGGSRRRLIDYAELPDQAAADDDGPFSGAHRLCARPDFAKTTPAAVAAASAYGRK
ncbi:hypothetical protein ACP4OV_018762 [Aristida adscensionis]